MGSAAKTSLSPAAGPIPAGLANPLAATGDFVAALQRGLQVLECFGPGQERLTLSQVAVLTGLSRGTARRFLLTLVALDYLGHDGKLFWLAPKVLRFSHGYLASFGRAELVKPVIQHVSQQLNESCSMAVLDGADIVYVARVEARRAYSSRIDIGTRLPAHASSLGRVLLAGLPDAALDAWLARHKPHPWTARTITDPALLRAKILEARRQRHAILDGELELGARSIAVPVLDAGGQTVAALNIGTSTARAPLDQLRRVFLPVLRAAAQEISQSIVAW